MNQQKLMKMAQDLHDTKKELRAVKKILKQCKSIVKTVDSENLPDGWGLCFDSKNNINYGYITGTSAGNLYCETESHEVYGISHYIEQKDLIELFGGGK